MNRRGWPLRAAKILAFLLVIGGALLLSERIQDLVRVQLMPDNEAMVHRIVLSALVAYVVLTSLPFLPGAEVGLSLLAAFGAPIAPAIYVATILALSIAFLFGRLVPCRVTAGWLGAVGLKRGAALARELGDASPAEAARFLSDRTKNPLLSRLVQHRYLALALAINMPGNVIFGGGGGIALAAGLSRTFHPVAFVLTVMIAVLPVPLAFLLTAQ